MPDNYAGQMSGIAILYTVDEQLRLCTVVAGLIQLFDPFASFFEISPRGVTTRMLLSRSTGMIRSAPNNGLPSPSMAAAVTHPIQQMLRPAAATTEDPPIRRPALELEPLTSRNAASTSLDGLRA